MITREHIKDDAPSTAIYSDCERYRYMLTRVWEPAGERALFVMLNPSTATEVQNDPTVERCERRARALGFGSFRVTNIFAWRDTDPKKMRESLLRGTGLPLYHLGLTKAGHPKHPLYISYQKQPELWG
ncbi:MAG: DUF1643 domain-containing protein [Maritimibacter sp.]